MNLPEMLNMNKEVWVFKKKEELGYYDFVHLYVVPQLKMITVLLKVLPYLGVMDKRGEMLCKRKVRERHNLFGNIGSSMWEEHMAKHYKAAILL